MDDKHFDQLSRILSRAGARRGVLHFLTALPLLGGLAALLGEEETAAKGRRRRRRKRHKHGQGRPKNRRTRKKTKQKCKAKSRAKTCAGKCGIVKNRCNLQKKINCGPCGPCHPACAADALCLDGQCQPCTVTCPSGPCPDAVQAAIDAAADGATLYLCPGVYGPAHINGKGIHLIGAGDGPGGTELRGDDGTVVAIEGSVPRESELRGLHLTGGSDSGVQLLSQGVTNQLNMRDCTVSGNRGPINGGGILNFANALQMSGCTVRDNDAGLNGGGIFSFAGTLEMSDCTIEDNTAEGTGRGGGIYTAVGEATLTGCIIRDNEASGGGGIWGANNAAITLSNTQVTGNVATGPDGGGGIRSGTAVVSLDAGSLVCDNEPDQCVGFSSSACQEVCPS